MRVNFSDAVERGNFEAFAGKHHVKITDMKETEIKNDGKLPAGTPGVTFEFTVQEGPNENRKCWNNFWFAPSTLGFLKTCLKATGEFDDAELDGDFDLDEDRIIGLDLVIRTKVRSGGEQYDDSTSITGYYAYDPNADYTSSGASSSSAGGSFLPS